MPIFQEVAERLHTMSQVNNTRQIVIGGDFNLHLDTCSPKGRTCRYVNDMIQELRLIDAGKSDKIPTWRWPNRPGTKSRLDYIIHSESIQGKNVEVAWSQLDHAQVSVTLNIGKELHKKRVFKDWVLTQAEFITQAQGIIKDTLLDHSQHAWMSTKEREKIIAEIRILKATWCYWSREWNFYGTHILNYITKTGQSSMAK